MTTRTPFFTDDTMTLWHGNALAVLRGLPDQSINCVVTSPPYFGLRDYGTGQWVGGDPDCAHTRGGRGTAPDPKTGIVRPESAHRGAAPACIRCGATLEDEQIGAEPTVQEYAQTLRELFGEVRRVLTDDGTCFVNLGDSYASKKATGPQGSTGQRATRGFTAHGVGGVSALPDKNLHGAPWRVAFAMQDDGWILRNDIVWTKDNAMPESVGDRFSQKKEYVFFFTKTGRYHSNLDAVRVPAITADRKGPRRSYAPGSASSMRGTEHQEMTGPFAGLPLNELGKNPGDVWHINTVAYPGAHFATMPPELAERCLAFGCPPGGTALDPFSGSGTTGMVAARLGLRYVGIDLNANYLTESLHNRLAQPGLYLGDAA